MSFAERRIEIDSPLARLLTSYKWGAKCLLFRGPAERKERACAGRSYFSIEPLDAERARSAVFVMSQCRYEGHYLLEMKSKCAKISDKKKKETGRGTSLSGLYDSSAHVLSCLDPQYFEL